MIYILFIIFNQHKLLLFLAKFIKENSYTIYTIEKQYIIYFYIN